VLPKSELFLLLTIYKKKKKKKKNGLSLHKNAGWAGQ